MPGLMGQVKALELRQQVTEEFILTREPRQLLAWRNEF